MERFRQDGYGIARAVFSAEEVRDLRQRICQIQGERDSHYPYLRIHTGDALSLQSLRDRDYVILDPRILAIARQLLGHRLVYHGDSSIQIGEGPRGFHKDNADRDDPAGVDWQGEYRLVRMGLYLQDHDLYSGGLKVRRHSHRYVSHHRGRASNLATRAGDVVFWYLTTSHSGNAVRLRGFPGLTLHPRIERLIPPALRVPEKSERMAVFCTYAAPGAHLDNYLEYQRRRPDVREHWLRCAVGTDLDNLANSRGVDLLRPSEDFGSNQQRNAGVPDMDPVSVAANERD